MLCLLKAMPMELAVAHRLVVLLHLDRFLCLAHRVPPVPARKQAEPSDCH